MSTHLSNEEVEKLENPDELERLLRENSDGIKAETEIWEPPEAIPPEIRRNFANGLALVTLLQIAFDPGPIPNLSGGIYVAELHHGEFVERRKLIIQ